MPIAREILRERTSGPKGHIVSALFSVGVKAPTYQPIPTTRTSFSAAYKAARVFRDLCAG